ncbi:adhesion G-protein coupled receptor G5 isoform X2 [Arvicanthis niloticus]
MDPHGALFFCLCLLAAQVVLVETQSEILTFMKRLEQPIGRSLFSRGRHIQHLEQMLLNASFCGHNLTLQTNSIQSLVFKLSCDFSGLSLSSATLTNVSQAWAPHAMQFPDELTKGTCVTSRPAELRLICIYFFTTHLFQDDQNSLLLNNYVLGAQLDHKPVKNLQKPVNISFWHNRSLEGYTVTCVFWKEGASNRSWGAWSPEGCYTEQPSGTQVLCHCNHLTYFAVLMQFSGDPVPTELRVPLEYISLVGCSISIVASLLSILLCAHSRKQSDSTTGIHMNLHGSVLLLNVTFLLSSQMALPTVPRPVCMVLAATLHYALLSSLTWMAIEGLNLYLLLGRVYNIYIHRYLLKLCLLGWGKGYLSHWLWNIQCTERRPHVLLPFIVAISNSISVNDITSTPNTTIAPTIMTMSSSAFSTVITTIVAFTTSNLNIAITCSPLSPLPPSSCPASATHACFTPISTHPISVIPITFFTFPAPHHRLRTHPHHISTIADPSTTAPAHLLIAAIFFQVSQPVPPPVSSLAPPRSPSPPLPLSLESH